MYVFASLLSRFTAILFVAPFALSQVIVLYGISFYTNIVHAPRTMDRGIVIFDALHLRKHTVCECFPASFFFFFLNIHFIFYTIIYNIIHTFWHVTHKHINTVAMDCFRMRSYATKADFVSG